MTVQDPAKDALARLQALQERVQAQPQPEGRQDVVEVDAPEPTYVEGLQSRLGRGAQDLVEGVIGDPLGLAAFSARKAGAENVAKFFERGREGVSQGMEQVWAEQRAKVDAFQSMEGSRVSRLVEQTLPGLGGGMLAFALGGGALGKLGKAAGLAEKGLLSASKVGLAATGGGQQAVSMYYEAKARGADESTATKAFWWGLPIGATEAYLGFGRRLGELDAKVSGAIGKTLVRMALDGGEEFVQNKIQRVLTDLTAQGLYDPRREVFLGLDDEDAAAAILGALGGVAISAGQAVAKQPGLKDQAAGAKDQVDQTALAPAAPQPTTPPPPAAAAPTPSPAAENTQQAPVGAPAEVAGGVAPATAPLPQRQPGQAVPRPPDITEERWMAARARAASQTRGHGRAAFNDALAGEIAGLGVENLQAEARLAPKKKGDRIIDAEGRAGLVEFVHRRGMKAGLVEYALIEDPVQRHAAMADTLELMPPDIEPEQGPQITPERARLGPPEPIRVNIPGMDTLNLIERPKPAAAAEPEAAQAQPVEAPEPAAEPPPPPKAEPEPAQPKEVSAFPGGLLKLPGVREFASGLKRNLTSRGHLPAEAFEADIKRKASANAEIQGIHNALRDFHRAAKADLGKTPDRMSPAEIERIDQVLKGGTAESLPPRLRKATARMREGIDRMSRALIRSGAIDVKLIPHIRENEGFYTTRSYRVFDDPKWADEVPVEIRNKAKALIRGEFAQRARQARRVYATRARLARARADEARVMKQGARKPEKHEARAVAHEAHARKMVEKGKAVQREMPDELAEGKIAALLFEGKAAQGPIALIKKGKLGSKDLSILTRRKKIAPEIRALYGEYKDPRINYARSVVRMAHLIANQKFLKEVREAGMGTFLREEPTVENGVEYKAKIAADESNVMSPLNGLYTTPEIDQAFRDATTHDPLPTWLRVFLGINSAAKLSKTVGNPISAQRNLIGNVGFAIAQGHWRAWKMEAGVKSVGVKWGITDAITDRMTTLESKSVAQWRAYYKRALELGVIHEDSRSGEIRDAIKDAAGTETNAWLEKRTARALKLPVRAALEYYRVGDDLWKIYAWENEKARYRKAKPEWSEAEVEAHTAQIVRNTYPTYSLVPRGVKLARRFPLTGPFLSFPAEVYRNAKNTAQLIREELSDPDLRGIGAQRLVGSLTAATMTAGLAVALRALYGITADDDDDAREFVPPWTKNSDIAWLEWGEEGKARYIDLSYSDPWNYLKEPLLAVMRADDPEDAAWSAFWAAAEPLLSEEIAAAAFLDIMRNKTKTGGQVYNEAASPTDRALAITEHIWKALEPGAIDTMRRIEMGLTGEVTAYGREYDPKVEALAVFSGLRVTDLDPLQAINFLAGDYAKKRAAGSRMASSVFTRQGTVTDEDLRNAMESADTARQGAYEDMRAAVRAALDLGVPADKVFGGLRAGGLSAEEADRLITTDEPEPWELSRTTHKEMSGVLGDQETNRRLGVYEATRGTPTTVAER